jgi:hypothetical protein
VQGQKPHPSKRTKDGPTENSNANARASQIKSSERLPRLLDWFTNLQCGGKWSGSILRLGDTGMRGDQNKCWTKTYSML